MECETGNFRGLSARDYDKRQSTTTELEHSDLWSAFSEFVLQEFLRKHEPQWQLLDNAVMESFFLNLNMERAWQRDYANHAEAMSDISDYFIGFYNSVCLRPKLANLPPSAFKQQSAINQPISFCEITCPGHARIGGLLQTAKSAVGAGCLIGTKR